MNLNNPTDTDNIATGETTVDNAHEQAECIFKVVCHARDFMYHIGPEQPQTTPDQNRTFHDGYIKGGIDIQWGRMAKGDRLWTVQTGDDRTARLNRNLEVWIPVKWRR